MQLQKSRFFEELQEKYWNQSAKGFCPDTAESEGITLESLGGVYIATLFGLAVSLVVLVIEIIYYRRRVNVDDVPAAIQSKDDEAAASAVVAAESASPESRRMFKSKVSPKQVTIGSDFVPASEKKPQLSYISVFPRKPIHDEWEFTLVLNLEMLNF